jgi:hypothetical protein
MMNLERAAMRGKLAELQISASRLKSRIEGAATAIRAGLNTTLTPASELAVPELDEQWDTLKTAWAELARITADIARLERELK